MDKITCRELRTSQNAEAGDAGSSAGARWFVLGLGLFFAVCVAIIALGTPASAGSCVLGPRFPYEVDDDYLASNPGACQYKTIQEVMLVSLVPGDVILIHNGTYYAWTNVTTNGLSFVGESQKGVVVDASLFPNGIPFVVRAWDTNISTMSLVGDSWGLDVDYVVGATNRTSLENLTIKASAWGCVCWGPNTRIRNMVISGTAYGFHSENAIDVDGLRISSTGVGGERFDVYNPNSVYRNVSVVGGNATYGVLLIPPMTNTSFYNLLVENSTYAIYDFTTDSDIRFYGLTVRNAVTGLNLTGTGSRDIQGFVVRNAQRAVHGLRSTSLNITGADIGDVDRAVYWPGGAGLNVSNASIWNVTLDGIWWGVSYGLELRNVSFNNTLGNAVNCQASCLSVNWSHGTISYSNTAISLAFSPASVRLDNLSFLNNLAISVTIFFASASAPHVMENCTFRDQPAGATFVFSSGVVITNNRFVNISFTALSVSLSSYAEIHGNTFVASRMPFDFPLQGYATDWNYVNITADNLIDGKPIYFLLNASNVAVPADAAQVLIVNGTDVSVNGINEGNATVGVQVTLSRNISIANSVIGGYGNFIGLFASENVSVRNVTNAWVVFGTFLSADALTNLSIDRLTAFNPAPSGTVLTITGSQGVSIRNVLTLNFSVALWAANDVQVSIFNLTSYVSWGSVLQFASVKGLDVSHVTVVETTGAGISLVASSSVSISDTIIVNASTYGLYGETTDRASLFNVTSVGAVAYGLYLTGSNNWTVRNSTFASDVNFGAYLDASSDFRTQNSTYVSLRVSTLMVALDSFNPTLIHNNFYGGPLVNANGYGTWDGGWPTAGNYYSWAVGSFVDEMTGPGQNVAGTKDGVKDAPAYGIGGGKNDNYALMDPWPPGVLLTSPFNGSTIAGGTLLNFSISNIFDSVTWSDDAGGSGSLTYPHDLDTSGWSDGWHNITITATDGVAPTVVRMFSFEVDGSAPVFVSTPTLGAVAVARGVVIGITVVDPHLASANFSLDAVPSGQRLPWSIDTGNLVAGFHTLTLFANDTLGNNASYLWTFYVDDTDPALSLVDPVGDDYFQAGTQVTYAASDDFQLDRVSFTAEEVGQGWSYSGDLAANASDWSVDTSSFADGCYDLSVFATDAAGRTTSDAMQVCVDSSHPDLSAFVEFSADEDAPYTFEGALAQDLDPTPEFLWEFDDALLLAFTTLTGPSPTHTFATPGGYNIHLHVTDRAGNFAEKDFILYVNDLTPPSPVFDLPATWPEDIPLPLDANATTDNDGYWNGGANGNFTWTVVGTSGTWTVYEQVTQLNLTEPGFYNVTLNVTDSYGNFAALTKEVRLFDKTPPTLVVAGSTAVRNEGDTVAFNASGSSDNDPRGSLVFHWTFTYDAAPQSITGPLFSFRFVTAGSYGITLTVGDASGNEASQTLNQRINDIPAVTNTPPTTLEAGNIFEWSIAVADSDAGDTKTFTLAQGPSGMGLSTAGVLQWSTGANSYGVYDITVRVSDGIAAVNFSFVLRVTRPASASNHLPFFSSFPVQTGTPGASYTYTITVGDSDAADVLTLALAEAPAGMTLDGSKTLRWQIPANATENSAYQVRLVVSDGFEFVYQNFTVRIRTNNQGPHLVADKIPTTITLTEGQTVAIVLTPDVVTDGDDAFGNLTFYATASDPRVLSVRVGLNGQGQLAIFVTGLKPGSSTLTVRVADPSGASQSQQVTAAVSSTAPAFDMTLLFLIAALVGAGVLGIIVMKRRKKDEGLAPLPGTPSAPAAPASPAPAQVVTPEVVEIAAPSAVVAPAVTAGAAIAVGRGAESVTAPAPRVAPPPAPVAVPARPSKAATYVIEGVFVIYQDGRMIYSKTDIGQQQLGDPELVSSMFTAVQQFIKDSFSAEGELNKMGYGENQILIERGNNLFMAVITFGEPDKELQETMETTIEKMEYAYAGVVENWDGQQNRFKDVAQYVAPLLALTAGISRQDVLAATTTKDVKVLSQLEFFQGFVRLKVGVKNDTEAVITKVTLDIDYNEDVLRLQRIEPASYKTSGARVMLNVLNPGEKSSVAYYFDPQICTETNIDGIIRYRDYKGVLQSVTMKTRKAEVVCPLFFTKEHANTAMLKRLIESELQERDSKVYTITKLPPYVKHKDIFDVCKQVVLSHDVHMVREFVSYNPFSGEAWFYGETKVKGYKIVIRTAVREDNAIEFFAASSVIKAVTGLLAEFNHTLVSMIVERYSDVKIEQVYDENVKHQIQSKALVDKLGEGEAGAGETDQS